MDDYFTAITNYGFPVVVASYLLFRFEKKIDALEDSINGKDGLIVTIKALSKKVDELIK